MNTRFSIRDKVLMEVHQNDGTSSWGLFLIHGMSGDRAYLSDEKNRSFSMPLAELEVKAKLVVD